MSNRCRIIRIFAFLIGVLAGIAGITACSDVTPDRSEETMRAWDGQAPTVDFDAMNPAIVFPDTAAPEDLQVWPVREGTGITVQESDYVMVNYVGQVWGKTKAFDSSFKVGQPAVLKLDSLIEGWQQALQGLPVGSAVLMSVPPDLAYGDEGGNSSANIKRDDVLAFYVEVVKVFGEDQGGQADAQLQTDPAILPVTLNGEMGGPVTVSIKADAPQPATQQAWVVGRGTGAPVGGEGSTAYIQYALTYWDNSSSESSYSSIGPQPVTVATGTPFDVLEGIPVGSRVLIVMPAVNSDNTQLRMPAYAAVIDILAQVSASE